MEHTVSVRSSRRLSDSFIRELQATFAEYPAAGKLASTPPEMLKFEKQTGVEPAAQIAGILSTFSRFVHCGPLH